MLNFINTEIPLESLEDAVRGSENRSPYPEAGAETWRVLAAHPCCVHPVTGWRRQAEEELQEPWSPIPAELYGIFSATGDRSRFDALSAARRRRLGLTALIAAMDPSPEWVRAMMAGWEAVLSEPSWALPAHVEAESGMDPMRLDLVCAGTAALLAALARVFHKWMPEDRVAQLRERLRRQVWENYLLAAEGAEETPRGVSWIDKRNNWNAVCHRGVLVSALLLSDDTAMKARLLHTAGRHLKKFLAGFGADGGCAEGPSYWSYGFGSFAGMNAELESLTDFGLSAFEGDEKIARIALNPLIFGVEDGKVINFSDGSATHAFPPGLLGYLGSRLAEPNLQALAENAYGIEGNAEARDLKRKTGFFHAARYLLHCPPDARPGRGKPVERPSTFLPDLQVWASRGKDGNGRRWVVAAKCGHNGEFHNHNDVGSFVLFLDGVNLISEIGAPSYNREFFRQATRYSFTATRSFGHSVPFINGMEQSPGEAFHGRVISSELGSHEDHFIIDLAGAYPAGANCTAAKRNLMVSRSNFTLRLVEHFRVTRFQMLETVIITHGEVVVEKGVVWIRRDGVSIRLQPDSETLFRCVQELEYRNHSHQPAFVRRIVFEPRNQAPESTTDITFIPADRQPVASSLKPQIPSP